jgi:hypothetical protein
MAKKNKSSKKEEGERRDAERRERQEEEIELDTERRFDSSKPHFRNPREQSEKVVLDERFASVLTDPKFKLDIRDKYGRKKSKDRAKNELSAFYEVEDEPADPNGEGETKDDREVDGKGKDSDDKKTSDGESASETDEDEPQFEDPASRIAYLTALSRGELGVSSSSEESDSDEQSHSSKDGNDSEATDDVMGKAGILDPSKHEEEVELTSAESPYLAVMNLDWSHVRAVDIFSVVSSFSSPGSVKSVRVYASDFGIERMEKEQRFGPSGLWKKSAQMIDDPIDEPQDNFAEDSEEEEDVDTFNLPLEEALETDFDPEKLREYETSRLKYFFAVVEMVTPSHADTVYKEVDGLEFEHSSVALDVRAIPTDDLVSVTKDRPMRDEASSLPSNYVPPEFVVTALQATSVQCTWEAGDRERDRSLTKYASSGQDWRSIAESDDLRAYLGSDASSDEEAREDGKGKATAMRKMLGLGSDDDGDDESDAQQSRTEDQSEASNDEEKVESESFLVSAKDGEKEVSFVPGAEKLEDKIRSAMDKKKNGEMTPWDQFLEKKKQKRIDRKALANAKRMEVNETRRGGSKNDMFHASNYESEEKTGKRISRGKSKAELELLVACDDGEEEAKDYDMRGLQRIDQNKTKKLKGARKRKEAALEAIVTGTDFQVNVEDGRFSAVLDGSDDRFGIDMTDSNYKETPAMRKIMSEQTRRRKKRKQAIGKTRVPDVSADSAQDGSSGASALSSLVSRLKEKAVH